MKFLSNMDGASKILEDAAHRFVSDTEKSAWNAKQNSLGSGTTSQYLRGDGSWATPPDTTYSAMSVSEGATGTATSSRTVRADYLKQIIQNYIPSSLPANGGNADTVDGKHASDFALASQVLTNVPSGAKFTDTVYTHPTSDGNKHVPATGTTNNGKVLKAGATAGSLVWGTDNDTITTVNGKTGAITKADIVALGIPAQDTVYTHPAGTNPHGTTKSDLGLDNVDNIKQMPISGGVLENYREKLTTLSGTSTTINLSLGNVFTHTLSGNTTYSITNAVNGQAHSFTLIINMGSPVRALTFPTSVKWQGGEIPDMTTANKTYVSTFMSVDGGTTWLGMFGGEF